MKKQNGNRDLSNIFSLGKWNSRAGNHKPKNGNGIEIRIGIWAKYMLARKWNLVEVWAGDGIYTFHPFLTFFCAKHSKKLTNVCKNTGAMYQTS